MGSSKTIVILFDMGEPPPEDHNYNIYDQKEGWDEEWYPKKALERMGHKVIYHGVFDNVEKMVRDLKEAKPDLVFNMCEAFNNNRRLEPQIAGILELLGIPYTGVQAAALNLCQDKALSKKVLQHHRIRVPRWVTSLRSHPIRSLKSFSYPAFIKLKFGEASEGISQDSYVENERDCIDRIRFLHENFKSDVIVEEFVPGKELYVSLLGAKRPKVFPIRELYFREWPEDTPKFATFKTKWDEKYRKRWGIQNRFATGLSTEQITHIENMSKKAFKVLGLSGYARFDFRLNEATDEIVMLEANPNPSLSPWEDYVKSAKKGGMEYDDLIAKIIELA